MIYNIDVTEAQKLFYIEKDITQVRVKYYFYGL